MLSRSLFTYTALSLSLLCSSLVAMQSEGNANSLELIRDAVRAGNLALVREIIETNPALLPEVKSSDIIDIANGDILAYLVETGSQPVRPVQSAQSSHRPSHRRAHVAAARPAHTAAELRRLQNEARHVPARPAVSPASRVARHEDVQDALNLLTQAHAAGNHDLIREIVANDPNILGRVNDVLLQELVAICYPEAPAQPNIEANPFELPANLPEVPAQPQVAQLMQFTPVKYNVVIEALPAAQQAEIRDKASGLYAGLDHNDENPIQQVVIKIQPALEAENARHTLAVYPQDGSDAIRGINLESAAERVQKALDSLQEAMNKDLSKAAKRTDYYDDVSHLKVQQPIMVQQPRLFVRTLSSLFDQA